MSKKFNLKKANFSFAQGKNIPFQPGLPEHGCYPENWLSGHIHPPRWVCIPRKPSIPAWCLLSPSSLEPSLASHLSSPWGASGNTRGMGDSSGGGEWENPLPVCHIPEIQTLHAQACQTIYPQSHMEERQER